MKKFFLIAGTVAVTALLAGCAKKMMLDDPTLYDQYLTRTYNQPAGKCFYAVQVAFAERGVELTKVDTDRGRIVTERHVIAYYAVPGEVGSLSDRYYIDVSGNKKQCTIKVSKYKAWRGNNEMTWVKPDEVYAQIWEPMFRSFEGHLNDDEEDELADTRSPESIDNVIKKRSPDLKKIYNKYKESKPGTAGRVALKFTIDSNGDVAAISVESSTTKDSTFDEVVKMAVSTWNFGRIAKGKNTTVTIPFTFSTDEE